MKDKLKFQSIFIFYCICIGLFIGALSSFFLKLANFLTHSVWTTIPEHLNLAYYPLIVGLLGGLLVGLFQVGIGDYPKTMHDSLNEFRETNKISYENHQVLKNFMAALIVLTFGASLGPEAALVSILGGMISWLGDRMKLTLARKEEFLELSFGVLLSIIFRAPLVAVSEPLEEQYEKGTIDVKWEKIFLYGLTTAAGVFSFVQAEKLFPSEAVFEIRLPEVLWTGEVFLLILPALMLGTLFGYLFLLIEKGTEFIAGKINQPLILALTAGLFIGIFGMLSPYFLFSGEHEIFEFSKEAAGMSAVTLLFIGVGKAFLTNICFSFKWRGGKIFPAIFCSTAIGFVLANLFPYTPALTIAIAVSASVTIILKQPVVVAALLLFLFPLQFFPFIIIACLLTGKFADFIGKRVGKTA